MRPLLLLRVLKKVLLLLSGIKKTIWSDRIINLMVSAEQYKSPNECYNESFRKTMFASWFFSDVLNYLLVKNPKIDWFYLLPKLRKLLQNFLQDQLVKTADFTLKLYLHFWTTICNHLLKKLGLNLILSMAIIF